jgi:hypothetical protein
VTRTIGFIFFLDLANSERKTGQILTPLAENLNDVEKRKKRVLPTRWWNHSHNQ